MPLNLEDLNPNQRVAVNWDGGPLLVLAGPGSGKTRVLTLHVTRLILESPGKRFRVLGLTFTNKAAAEMRGRVNTLLADGQERVLLTTFHSFCAEILRQHGSHLGLRPDFTILNQEGDRQGVLSDVIAELESEGVGVRAEDVRLLNVLDRFLHKLLPEDRVRSQVRDQAQAEKLVHLYPAYRRGLLRRNLLDFPSLLFCAHELLVSQPAVAKQIRLMYPRVCVDEFQDTNYAQYQILRDLVGPRPEHLFVVADDDQIIYQWNGASPDRLTALRKEFSMEVIQLPTNFRCPPEVVRLANNLIRNNTGRSTDKASLIAAKTEDGGNPVRVMSFDTSDEELAWIADDIAQRPQDQWGKCVILGRTNGLLEEAARVINERGQAVGLQAALAVRKNEFQCAPLRWLHATLRLAAKRTDREQLRRLCRTFHLIEGIEIRPDAVIAGAGGEQDYLRGWFGLALARPELEAATRPFLERGRNLLVAQADLFGFLRLAFEWLAATVARLQGQGSDAVLEYEQERDAWRDLQTMVLERYGEEQTTLQVFLQEFDLNPKTPPVPPNAVRCFTIHAAKGMEFGHVYLTGLAEGILPSYQSVSEGDSSPAMEEERRSCFVAITRTEIDLTLTYSHQHFGRYRDPSRFLLEMGF